MQVFLLVLGLIWLIAASIQDLRKREIANWVSFSFIIFSLVYVVFYSLFNSDIFFLVYRLIGLAVFIGLGYLFYYSRIFAGGDAKLIMGLGVIITLSSNLANNFTDYAFFVFFMLLSGGIYGLVYSFVIAAFSWNKFKIEFRKEIKKNRYIVIFSILAIISIIPGLLIKDYILLFFPLIFIVFPFLFSYAKAVENCLIRKVSWKEVTVGDWLYEKVRVGKNSIMPYWEGLDEEQVYLIRKNRKSVIIKQGIPFVPAILIAYVLFLIMQVFNLIK